MINFGQYPAWVIILLIAWVLPWKGFALWTAANKKHKVWFILILILNTFAVLEIIYIFYVAKIPPKEIFGKKKEEPKIEENQNGQQ
jgi:hypothetical protein